jgi:hypothetical protein
MSPSENILTRADTARDLSDAIGVMPLLAGAFPGTNVNGRGLFLDHPIFYHQPPVADLKTGKWSDHTKHIAGTLQNRMQQAGVDVTDVLCTKIVDTKPTTALSEIIGHFKSAELKLANKVKTDIEKISGNNAHIRLKIVQSLREAAASIKNNHPISADGAKEAKRVVCLLIRNSKKAMEEQYTKNGLTNLSHLNNESFLGGDDIGKFYDTYIASDTHDVALLKIFKEQEISSIHAYLNWVSAIHEYYDLIVEGNGLKDVAAEANINAAWRDVAYPVPTDGQTANIMNHMKKADWVVGRFVWSVLLERFEICSSIAHTFLNGMMGRGYAHVGDTTKHLTEMIILFAVAPVFVARNPSLDLYTQVSNAGSQKDNLIIHQIRAVHNDVKSWLELVTTQIQTYDVGDITAVRSPDHITDVQTLRTKINHAIFGKEAVSIALTEKANVVLTDLCLVKLSEAIATYIRNNYNQTKKAATEWVISNQQSKSLTAYVPYKEIAALQQYVLEKARHAYAPVVTEAAAGTSAQSGADKKSSYPDTTKLMRIRFAGNLIWVLHRKDAIFLALFVLNAEDKRGELGPKVLKAVNSALALGDAAFDASDSALATLKKNPLSLETWKAEATGKTKALALFNNDADFNTMFKMHDSIRNHSALTKMPRVQTAKKAPAKSAQAKTPRPQSTKGKGGSKSATVAKPQVAQPQKKGSKKATA